MGFGFAGFIPFVYFKKERKEIVSYDCELGNNFCGQIFLRGGSYSQFTIFF